MCSQHSISVVWAFFYLRKLSICRQVRLLYMRQDVRHVLTDDFYYDNFLQKISYAIIFYTSHSYSKISLLDMFLSYFLHNNFLYQVFQQIFPTERIFFRYHLVMVDCIIGLLVFHQYCFNDTAIPRNIIHIYTVLRNSPQMSCLGSCDVE